MSVRSSICDGGGGKAKACVTTNGQLVTSPISYDDTKYVELDVINTAYNFYEAKPGKRFVITFIRAKADRGVSSTADADVIIYEGSSSSTTTVDKTLHQEAMVRGEFVTMNVNILVTEGKYVNAKTTDDDIHMTIMGYFLDALD
jgi:hypothetical protein